MNDSRGVIVSVSSEKKVSEQEREERRRQREERLSREREKRRLRQEEEQRVIIEKLAGYKQVEIAARNLSWGELERAKKSERPVMFLLEGKVVSPPMKINKMINKKSGMSMELQDEKGCAYKISCYKRKGGPGHLIKIRA